MLSAQTEKYWKEKAAAIQGITGWAPVSTESFLDTSYN